MNTLLISILLAAGLVAGIEGDARAREGKPILPKLRGFSPTAYLPPVAHPQAVEQVIEEDYYDDSSETPNEGHSGDPVALMDADADDVVTRWLTDTSAYTDQPADAPKPPENGSFSLRKSPEKNPENVEDSLNGSEFFQTENPENFRNGSEKESEKSSPYFDIDAECDEETEYAIFCDLVDQGYSEKGADIIDIMWGQKPGGNKGYAEAVRRRRGYRNRLMSET